MPHFNTKITGRDLPQTEDDWDALDCDELAMAVNRIGMQDAGEKHKPAYIRNHIAFVNANTQIERTQALLKQQQGGIHVDQAVISIEQRRADLLEAIDSEISERGISEPGGNGNGHHGGGNGNGHAPPQTG